MARFPDFPNELILAVVTFIYAEDLENFAQSCRPFHSVTSSTLEKHRLLIRQYSTLKNKGTRTIAKTLKAVLVNPEIGRYIRDVNLNYVGGNKRNFKPKYPAEDLELYVAASRDSEFLSPCGQTLASHRDTIERGNEDILLAILLPLLPNLRSLSFPRVSNDGDHCWTNHMFSYLPYVSTPTFAKLSSICVDDGYRYFHLDEAKVYANLPSVKSLSAPRLRCEIVHDSSLLLTLSSNITSLELRECRVPATHLHDFLLGFHCLQSFTYSCDLVDNTFDAFLIRSALIASAKTTLRKLTLLAYRRQSPVMGTLRPFEVLNEVNTDWGLLFSRKKCHSSIHEASFLPTQQWILDASNDMIRGFAMSLPNSLRKLTLHDEVGRGAWEYSDLVNSTVRAQERGTQVQPQPHENLVNFEWGLHLQELTIISNAKSEALHWPIDYPHVDRGPDRWRLDCKRVGITLRENFKTMEMMRQEFNNRSKQIEEKMKEQKEQESRIRSEQREGVMMQHEQEFRKLSEQMESMKMEERNELLFQSMDNPSASSGAVGRQLPHWWHHFHDLG